MDKIEIKNLKRRYLIWFYKTAKEELDKIERKFTQAQVDRFILKELRRRQIHGIEKFIEDFLLYIEKKEKSGRELKFRGKQLNPEYQFLVLKLEAIEKAIKKEFGAKTLKEIKLLYETEMIARILKSVEH